jgi:hypothetical protein
MLSASILAVWGAWRGGSQRDWAAVSGFFETARADLLIKKWKKNGVRRVFDAFSGGFVYFLWNAITWFLKISRFYMDFFLETAVFNGFFETARADLLIKKWKKIGVRGVFLCFFEGFFVLICINEWWILKNDEMKAFFFSFSE